MRYIIMGILCVRLRHSDCAHLARFAIPYDRRRRREYGVGGGRRADRGGERRSGDILGNGKRIKHSLRRVNDAGYAFEATRRTSGPGDYGMKCSAANKRPPPAIIVPTIQRTRRVSRALISPRTALISPRTALISSRTSVRRAPISSRNSARRALISLRTKSFVAMSAYCCPTAVAMALACASA